MIYFELQLDGKTRVYEQSDRLFLTRLRLLAEAEALPPPPSMAEAHDYARAGCFQFEMFADLAEAEAWTERYGGFRAGEVRAAFRRFMTRRGDAFLSHEFNKTHCPQNHNKRVAQHG
jgi:hypothetical protein